MGALAAMLGIDLVIAIGEKASRIADGAAQSGGSVLYFTSREEAMPEIRAQLAPGCAVLVKASHAMEFGKIVEQLTEEQ